MQPHDFDLYLPATFVVGRWEGSLFHMLSRDADGTVGLVGHDLAAAASFGSQRQAERFAEQHGAKVYRIDRVMLVTPR